MSSYIQWFSRAALWSLGVSRQRLGARPAGTGHSMLPPGGCVFRNRGNRASGTMPYPREAVGLAMKESGWNPRMLDSLSIFQGLIHDCIRVSAGPQAPDSDHEMCKSCD